MLLCSALSSARIAPRALQPVRMSESFSLGWLRARFRTGSTDREYARIRTQSDDSIAGGPPSEFGFEMESNHQSYGSNSSVIDQALLQNDELRSLLGVAPEKKPELPGPHMCSICCTIFSVMGAAFLVRARTLPRNA